MTLNRYGKKKDVNQGEIVSMLEKIGATVSILDTPCDLLVGYRGENLLLEVKDGSLPPSARKLTKAQEEFKRTWRGQFNVVTSVAEAFEVVTGRVIE
jgi:hypothetical protein